jgi:hypothetical protein
MSDAVLRRASEALGLAGIGIAGYLTYVHYAGLHPVCGISHGCETVQTSSYASLLGVPVAPLGLISYALILLSVRMRGERALLGGYALTLIAFTFSVYLTLPRGFHHPRDLLVVYLKRDRLHATGDRRRPARAARRSSAPCRRSCAVTPDVPVATGH